MELLLTKKSTAILKTKNAYCFQPMKIDLDMLLQSYL